MAKAAKSKASVALRQWLATRERSQQWLAERVGVTQSAVAWYLGGAEPRASVAAKIQRITGISVSSWGKAA